MRNSGFVVLMASEKSRGPDSPAHSRRVFGQVHIVSSFCTVSNWCEQECYGNEAKKLERKQVTKYYVCMRSAYCVNTMHAAGV